MGWALAAAVCAACYFVMSDEVTADGSGLNSITLAAGGLVVGAVAVALLGASGVMPLTFTANDTVIAGWTTSWVVPVVALALVPTAIAYTLGIMGIARLRPRFASLVGLAEVMFAVLAAWALLGRGDHAHPGRRRRRGARRVGAGPPGRPQREGRPGRLAGRTHRRAPTASKRLVVAECPYVKMACVTVARKRWPGLAAIASALVCGATVAHRSTPAAAESPCPDIEVVFARGTNDAPALGRVGQAFVDALRPQVGGRTLTSYAVELPRRLRLPDRR